MKLRFLFPGSQLIETSERDEFVAAVSSQIASIDGFRSNTVFSIGGRHIDDAGKSSGISNEVDRAILAALRRTTDVVVTGGNTARSESYRKPKFARLAIVTASADLTGVPAVSNADGDPVYIFTTSEGASRIKQVFDAQALEVSEIQEVEGDPTGHIQALDALRARGFSRALVESGVAVVGELARRKVLDDLCIVLTKQPNESFSHRHITPSWLGVSSSRYRLKMLAASPDTLLTVWGTD